MKQQLPFQANMISFMLFLLPVFDKLDTHVDLDFDGSKWENITNQQSCLQFVS